MKKLLMVCMGNICRSPMAQMVTAHLANQAGLTRVMQIDSAGTHAGPRPTPPDPRAKAVLTKRHYPIGRSVSRQVSKHDFGRYDWILAMDRANLNALMRFCPPGQTYKLKLFLDYAPDLDISEIPDPYYGGVKGFEHVLDLCEAGARGVIAQVQQTLPPVQHLK